MKLVLVLSAWWWLAVGLYTLRFGPKGTCTALLNGLNGFALVFRALFAGNTRSWSPGSMTLGECVGFAIGLLAVAIPAAFLWMFFEWSILWALNA